MKRSVALILAFVLLAAFCACGKSSAPLTESSAPAAVSSASDTVTDTSGRTSATDKEIRVGAGNTVTLYMGFPDDMDDYRAIFESSVNDLKKIMPDVTLDCRFDNDDYGGYISDGLYGREKMDLFFTPDAFFMKGKIDEGCIYSLEYAFHRYIFPNNQSVYDLVKYDNYVGSIPVLIDVYALYINYEVLVSYGYNDCPSDGKEFLDMLEVLKNNGVTPIGFSYDDLGALLETLLMRYVGGETFKMFASGSISWYDERVMDAADVFYTMSEKGYFDRDAKNIDRESARQKFIDGKSALYFGSLQDARVFTDEKANPKNFDFIGYCDFPCLNPEPEEDYSVVAKPVLSVSVPEVSENKEIALRYAAELATLMSEYGYDAGLGLPAHNTKGKNETAPLIFKEMRFYVDAYNLRPTADVMFRGDREINGYRSLVEELYLLKYDGVRFATYLSSLLW